MNPESSVHLSSPSSSSAANPPRFTMERRQYLDFIAKMLREYPAWIPHITTESIIDAYEFNGKEARGWVESHQVQAESIAEYSLRKAQLLSTETVEEEFLCSTLKDVKDLSKRIQHERITDAIKELQFDFGEMAPFYYHLRCEYEAYRYLQGESSICNPILMALKKDFQSWFSSRMRYLFPTSVEHKFQFQIDQCLSNDSSDSQDPEFEINSLEGRKILIYEPCFIVKIIDSKGLLMTFKFALQTRSFSGGNFQKVSYFCKAIPIGIWKNPARSFHHAANGMKLIYQDFINRQVTIKRLYKRRKTLIPNKPLAPLDLTAAKLCEQEGCAKKRPSIARSLKTPRRLSPSSLTSSAVVIFEKMSSSSSRTTVPKAQSARELKLNRVNKGTLSKASSFNRTLKQWKSRSREDFSEDVERLIPPLLSLLCQSSYEKNVKTYLQQQLEGYQKIFDEKTFQILLANESKRIIEFVPLSGVLHDFIKAFRYQEEPSATLSQFHQYTGLRLLEDPEFFSMLTSPDTYRRFLGKSHRKIPQDVKVNRLLKTLFYKLYASGYVEEGIKTRFHPEEHINWMAELRVKQMLNDCPHPTQQCLHPLIEGGEWVEQTFSKLFPFLHQKMSSECSETSSDEEKKPEETRITASFESKSKLRIKRTSHHLKVSKKYLVILSYGKNDQEFAHLLIVDHMVFNTEREIWKRELRIRNIDFLKETPLHLCQFVVDYMVSKSNCLKTSPPV